MSDKELKKRLPMTKSGYYHSLSKEDKTWLSKFEGSERGFRKDVEAIYPADKVEDVMAERYQDHDRYNRDIWTRAQQLPLIEEEFDAGSLFTVLSPERCMRCLQTAGGCSCPTTTRTSSYGPGDYAPLEFDEGSIIDLLDAQKRAAAYDLQPYGDCQPSDLKPNYKVKVCLPNHIYEGKFGTVVTDRPIDGDFLVKIADDCPLLFVRAEGLQHPPIGPKNKTKVPKV